MITIKMVPRSNCGFHHSSRVGVRRLAVTGTRLAYGPPWHT